MIQQYRFLQSCIKTFPLHHIDPTTGTKITFPPLPPQQTVNWYATTLAKTVLGIADPTPTGIQARVAAKRSQAGVNAAQAPQGAVNQMGVQYHDQTQPQITPIYR